jgi:raffinose/stachyose/melibiose transport system permease protein
MMPVMQKEGRVSRIASVFGKFMAYLVMSVFALMTAYPIVWLILNSFKPTPEYRVNRIGLPRTWTLVNYVGAWKIGEFNKLIGNSFFYTIGASIGIILVATLAGFAFAKIRSKATGPIYGSFVIGILLSIQSLMVPIFLEVSQLDRIISDLLHLIGIMGQQNVNVFYNSRFGVLVIYIGAGLPIAVYLCTEYIKGIPDSLIEAARLDGAGYFEIFRRIILPMAVPIAMTVTILNITKIWNEFALINILVSKTELKSMPLGIYRFSGSMASDYGKQFAALVIGMAPMLIFYIIFRKQITKGVFAGAVKG